MIAESSSNATAKPAPFKRSLFNKPSWSKPVELESPIDLFHRANHRYVDIAAEVERKRKAKIARREREKARQQGSEERAGKRRCLSDESEDDDEHSSNDEEPKISELNRAYTVQPSSKVKSVTKSASPPEVRSSPRSLAKRYQEAADAPKIAGKEDSYQSKILDLEDEESGSNTQGKNDEDENLQVTTIRPTKPSEPDDEPASDEEFPELARKAREKARMKRLKAETEDVTPDLRPSASASGYSQRSQSIQQSTPPPPPDAVVQILITSRIENSEPLIVSRKISRRLKDVRVTWCQRQGFSREFMDTVFLTWRGKRLFDVTTCKSLGIAVDQDGTMLTKGQKDILGEEYRQIHMEAITEKVLQEYRKEKRHAAGENEVNDHNSEEEIVAQPKEEAQVRIILKAKGVDDFKLIVKPVSCTFRYDSTPLFANLGSLLSYQG